jgi:hypothetical protein
MKPTLSICTAILAACTFVGAQQTTRPPGSTPPIVPDQSSRPEHPADAMPPDTSAPPATQQAPDNADRSSVGQSSSSQTNSSQSNVANRTEDQRVIEGCVMQNAADNSFSLRDDSGNNYKLSGDTSQLLAHVNEEVQITGRLAQQSQTSVSSSTDGAQPESKGNSPSNTDQAKSSSGASSSDQVKSSSSVSTQSNDLSVQSVKPIASVCRASK